MLISELRNRSNKFVKNLPQIIAKALDFNEKIEQLNKDQLQESILANGEPIINLKTTRPDYSPSYAAWKSKMYPQSFGSGKINIFLTGEYYKNMDLKIKYPDYDILSLVPYSAKLFRQYSNKLSGIAPKNQPKAQSISAELLAEEYRKQVLS